MNSFKSGLRFTSRLLITRNERKQDRKALLWGKPAIVSAVGVFSLTMRAEYFCDALHPPRVAHGGPL